MDKFLTYESLEKIKQLINSNKYTLGLFLVFHYIYFNTQVGENPNFQTLLSFYGSLGIILTIINMYNQQKTNYFSIVNTEINYFNNIYSNINNNITNFFLTHKELAYFYNELYNGVSNYKESDRNIMLEKIICNQILFGIDSLINYIDSFKLVDNSFQLKIAEEKLLKTIKKFWKSRIFVQHWKEFSKDLALKWTNDYIDMNT